MEVMAEKSIYQNYIESMYKETREYLYTLITTQAFDKLDLYYNNDLVGSVYYTCELGDECIMITADIVVSCFYDKNKETKFNRIKLFMPGESSGLEKRLLYQKYLKCTKQVTDKENIYLFLDIANSKY